MFKHLAVFVVVAASAFAQISASTSSGPAGFSGSARFGPPPPFGVPAITGAAYSGEEVSESVQVLADGTRITRNVPSTKVYRDSAGRTRTERLMFMGPAMAGRPAPASPVIIEITDPVAGAKYFLDTQNKVAHRQELPASGPPRARVSGGVTGQAGGGAPSNMPGLVRAAPQAGEFVRPETSTEKLGTQTIEGVLVEGTRHTMTWPEGSQGNDRPITSINEIWMSPELKVVVLSKSTDPRSGEHTRKLVNLSRTEPDPSLFQPPTDYTVVEEKGEFTIQWGSQRQ